MQPVRVIYCEEIPKRKAEIEDHLTKMRVPYKMWRSIHGKTWGIQATIPCDVDGPESQWRISPGQLGLIIGHVTLWQHCLVSGMQEVIILEDDALLVDGFKEKAENAISIAKNAGLDMLYLGWLDEHPRKLERVQDCVHKMIGDLPFGTHCYWVSRKGMEYLFATNQIGWGHIDVQIGKRSLPSMEWGVCFPSLALQRSQGKGKMTETSL